MKVYIQVIIMTLSVLNYSYATTFSTADFQIIEAHLSNADANTLVIFDVNEVLFQPVDHILQKQNQDYRDLLEQQRDLKASKSTVEKYESIIWLTRKIEPVDKRLIPLISSLQQRGIKTVALTNCFTGPHGHIKDMQNWRRHELETLGYSFDRSWPELLSVTFNQLEDDGRAVAYSHGIIYTSDMPKGPALLSFLKHTKQKFNKIIFVDDKMTNVNSVENALTDSTPIEFIGIEYTAVKDRIAEPLDKNRAAYQFNTLKHRHRWLSDNEADQAMLKQGSFP